MSYNYGLRPGVTQKLNTNNSSTASTAYYEITDHLMSSKDALKLLERFL